MIVCIGSTRPAKVDGAREALALIARIDPRFGGCRLEPHDLTHIAPRQPMSIPEILDGARRAEALSRAGNFSVGVEGGLHEAVAGVWSLQSWAAVTDGERWGYGAGPSPRRGVDEILHLRGACHPIGSSTGSRAAATWRSRS